MAMSREEITRRHLEKKLREAPEIDCACGCGEKIKSVNKHGRRRYYVNGHSARKYRDPLQYKREYLLRHKDDLRERKAKMRRDRRVELIKYKGGKCQNENCDKVYNGKNGAIFDFHHLMNKSFGISAGLTDYSMDRLRSEVDKCELLCSCCHSMKHSVEY